MHTTSKILNGRLAAAVATLRHGESIVIADAGLPVPDGVATLDLAVSPGLPGTMQLVQLLKEQLVLTEVRIATQMRHANATVRQQLVDLFSDTDLLREIDHVEGIESALANAKLIVQTGETTPYANVVLVGGLDFFDMSMTEAPAC
jgi:D-ribose pyranase